MTEKTGGFGGQSASLRRLESALAMRASKAVCA